MTYTSSQHDLLFYRTDLCSEYTVLETLIILTVENQILNMELVYPEIFLYCWPQIPAGIGPLQCHEDGEYSGRCDHTPLDGQCGQERRLCNWKSASSRCSNHGRCGRGRKHHHQGRHHLRLDHRKLLKKALWSELRGLYEDTTPEVGFLRWCGELVTLYDFETLKRSADSQNGLFWL